MPTYTIAHPDTGRVIRMTGDAPPDEASIDQAFRDSEPPLEPTNFASSSLQKGVELGKRVGGGILRFAGAEDLGQKIIAKSDARMAALERANPSLESSDVTGLGSGAQFVAENVIKAAPLAAGPMAAFMGGALVAPALGVTGLGAATLGGATSYLPSLALETGIIAADSDKIEGNRGKILAAAAPAAALDSASTVLTAGAAGILPKTLKNIAKATSRGARIAKGAAGLAGAAVGEAATESAQSPLEAWGAGKPVFNPGQEYEDNIVANTVGALTGGLVSGGNFTPEMREEMKESFFAGGAAGLGLAGGGKAVSAAYKKLTTPSEVVDEVASAVANPDVPLEETGNAAMATLLELTDPTTPSATIPEAVNEAQLRIESKVDELAAQPTDEELTDKLNLPTDPASTIPYATKEAAFLQINRNGWLPTHTAVQAEDGTWRVIKKGGEQLAKTKLQEAGGETASTSEAVSDGVLPVVDGQPRGDVPVLWGEDVLGAPVSQGERDTLLSQLPPSLRDEQNRGQYEIEVDEQIKTLEETYDDGDATPDDINQLNTLRRTQRVLASMRDTLKASIGEEQDVTESLRAYEAQYGGTFDLWPARARLDILNRTISDSTGRPLKAGTLEESTNVALRNKLSKIARIFGHDVTLLVDRADKESNAFISEGDRTNIYIYDAKGSDNPLILLGHEILHQMYRNNKPLYQELGAAFIELRDSAATDAYLNRIFPDKIKDGQASKESSQEWVADVFGLSMGRSQFWSELEKVKPSLAGRVAAFVQELIQKYKDKLLTGRSQLGAATIKDFKTVDKITADVAARYAESRGIKNVQDVGVGAPARQNGVQNSNISEGVLDRRTQKTTPADVVGKVSPVLVKLSVAGDQIQAVRATTGRLGALAEVASIFGKSVYTYPKNTPARHGMAFVDRTNHPDKIFFREGAGGESLAVMGHELHHQLPVAMRKELETYVLSQAKPAEVAAYKKRLAESYANAGQDLSADDITEEFIGDVVAGMFSRQSFWEKMAQQNPTLFTKVINLVRDLVTKAINAIKGSKFERVQGTLKDLKEVEKVTAKVFQKYARMYEEGRFSEDVRGGAEIKNSLAERLKPFYSQLERALVKMGGRMPIDQLTKMLKSNQVTDAEIANILGGMEGVVKKEQVLKAVKENSVELQDVMLGEPSFDVSAWWNDEGGANEEVPYSELTPAEQRAAAQQYQDEVGTYEETATQFSQYQEPGAVEGSYREMFVTAPSETKGGLAGKWVAPDDRKPGDGNGWQDGHSQYSDIQNPIVRIRFNTREVDGKNLIFIEEMQGPSDTNQSKMPEALKKRIYDIGVKRILSYAKENGFDGVAWTPGEVQAKRYDLSKQIDSVAVHKVVGKDLYDIYATEKGGTVDRRISPDAVTADKVQEYVGKDLAAKAVEEANKRGVAEYSGLDLKVGGEGLKSLYDKTLPALFKKYGKEGVGEAWINTLGPNETLGGRGRDLDYEDDGVLSAPFVPVTAQTPASYPLYALPDKRVINIKTDGEGYGRKEPPPRVKTREEGAREFFTNILYGAEAVEIAEGTPVDKIVARGIESKEAVNDLIADLKKQGHDVAENDYQALAEALGVEVDYAGGLDNIRLDTTGALDTEFGKEQTNEKRSTDGWLTEAKNQHRKSTLGDASAELERLVGDSIYNRATTSPRARKAKEASVLRKWATEKGLIQDEKAFNAQWSKQVNAEGKPIQGNEHDVIFNDDGTVTKRNHLPGTYHESYRELFDRVMLFNTLFGERSALTLTGFQDTESGLKPVFTQNYLGDAKSTITQTEKMLEDAGFEPVGQKTTAYRLPGTDIIITDVFGENTRRVGDVSVPMDYVIFHGDRAKSWLQGQIKQPTTQSFDESEFDAAFDEMVGGSDVKYSLPENMGYHAGDLAYGRDTTNGRMTAGRSSGHFGTGVYFVSNPEKIGISRAERPSHSVDFSIYNTLVPTSAQNGFDIHDGLKVVNNARAAENPAELIADATRKLSYALPGSWFMKQDELKGLISSAVTAAKEDFKFSSSDYSESASTRLLKALGYEGVDVRQYPQLDNTTYGSVIFGESVAPAGVKYALPDTSEKAKKWFNGRQVKNQLDFVTKSVMRYVMPTDRSIGMALTQKEYKPIHKQLRDLMRLKKERAGHKQATLNDGDRVAKLVAKTFKTKAEMEALTNLVFRATEMELHADGAVDSGWTQATWEKSGQQEKFGKTLKEAQALLTKEYKALMGESQEKKSAHHEMIRQLEKVYTEGREAALDPFKTFMPEEFAAAEAYNVEYEKAVAEFFANKEKYKELLKTDKAAAESFANQTKFSAPKADKAITDMAETLRSINAKYPQLKGDYFPMMRFGDVSVRIHEVKKDGSLGKRISTEFFDSREDAVQVVEKINANPMNNLQAVVESTKSLGQGRATNIPAVMIDRLKAAAEARGINGDALAQLMQDAEALRINMMPRAATSGHKLKREGVEGYNKNLLKVFSNYIINHANANAGIIYGTKIEQVFKEMNKNIQAYAKAAVADPNKSQAENEKAASEQAVNSLDMDNFYKYLYENERTSSRIKLNEFTKVVGKGAFQWYLTSPSIWAVQWSQPFMVTIPKMASKFGYNTAFKAYVAAAKRYLHGDFSDAKIDEFNRKHEYVGEEIYKLIQQSRDPRANKAALEKEIQSIFNQYKSEKDRRLIILKVLALQGQIDLSASFSFQDLAASSNTDGKTIDKISGAMDKLGSKTSIFMQHSETGSRRAAAISAFELAMQKSKSFIEANDYASEIINDTLYDFASENRGRAWQGNTGHILGQFQFFRLHMLGKMLQLFKDTTNAELKQATTPEEKAAAVTKRNQARKELAYMTGTSLGLAGAAGTPVAMVLGNTLTTAVLDAIGFMFGDDDDPWDFKRDAELVARDLFGDTLGNIMLKGLPSLVGADVSQRIGLGNIGDFVMGDPPAGVSPTAKANWYAGRILGPAWGMVSDSLRSGDALADGDIAKAIQYSSPKVVRDFFRAAELDEKGVQGGGKTIMKPEDVNPYSLGLMMVGINPLEVALASEESRYLKNLSTSLSQKRSKLIGDLAKATADSDSDAKDEAIERINSWSAANPKLKITAQELATGVRKEMKKRRGTLTPREQLIKDEFGR